MTTVEHRALGGSVRRPGACRRRSWPPIPSPCTSGSPGTPEQPTAIAAKKEIAAYEEAHPGVKIDVQNITYDAMHDKLLTALAGGDAPD